MPYQWEILISHLSLNAPSAAQSLLTLELSTSVKISPYKQEFLMLACKRLNKAPTAKPLMEPMCDRRLTMRVVLSYVRNGF